MSIFQNIKKGVSGVKKNVGEAKHWVDFALRIRPSKSFGKYQQPLAPDYANLQYWAAHPDKKDKSDMVPQGIKPTPTKDLQADVFFIHPTTFFGNNNWNASLTNVLSNKIVDEAILPGQASVFNSCCRIFAPRYRQATFYSFLEGGKNAHQALELAYEDVANAFDFYIQNYNEGRPFFVASHSQGTLHAVRLLEEKIDKMHLVNRLVAAYTIGFEFPKIKFEKDFENIKISQNATDTRCVIAYDTYVEGAKGTRFVDRNEHFFSKKNGKWEWKKRAKFTPVAVNPISWNTQTTRVDASQHLGAVNLEYAKRNFQLDTLLDESTAELEASGLSAPFPNEVSARCGEQGYLYISKPKHRIFSTMLLPRGNYHNYDYSLFYMDLRKNIKARLDAFL
ncbi:MAG TPA: DUF3089 domain-containing protein [Phaeodactylibacter sp.]|nr:DUF3089 domain-containing protein [Phaeodactylibacter sp.]